MGDPNPVRQNPVRQSRRWVGCVGFLQRSVPLDWFPHEQPAGPYQHQPARLPKARTRETLGWGGSGSPRVEPLTCFVCLGGALPPNFRPRPFPLHRPLSPNSTPASWLPCTQSSCLLLLAGLLPSPSLPAIFIPTLLLPLTISPANLQISPLQNRLGGLPSGKSA